MFPSPGFKGNDDDDTRGNAASSVAPVEAREQLEAIVSANWFPQSGDAGMTIRGLEDGTFKPE